ncbi:MAG: 2OG-Fe(II) oxygenase family protein [Pseudomonadota bacterium]
MSSDLDTHPVADRAVRSVPTVDASRLADPRRRDDAVAAIAAACEQWGFFQLINHGLPDALIEAVWREARWLFEQPAGLKRALERSLDNPWGYYCNELTKNQRDKKEVFDYTSAGVDPIYASENRWPANRPAFRTTMLAYFDACTALALRLVGVLCEGLGLDRGALESYFAGRHTGFIRLNHYPVADPLAAMTTERLSAADMGVHHHSDAGALTLLLQDQVGGLQVYRDGYWYAVEPQAGALVINTGDMLQVWSNDRYQAAVHRVLAMREVERYSVPFFFNPRADAVIAPLRDGRPGEAAPRYRPVRWSAFRGARTAGDYADYGAEVQIADFRQR